MPLLDKIKEFIETVVRPELQEDGGDVEFVDFEDGTLKVKLYGSCAGCPSSLMHLQNVVEDKLKHEIPEIEDIELVHGSVDEKRKDDIPKIEDSESNSKSQS